MNKGRREGQGERANNNKEFSYVFVWCLFRSLIGPKSGQNPKKKKHPNLQPHFIFFFFDNNNHQQQTQIEQQQIHKIQEIMTRNSFELFHAPPSHTALSFPPLYEEVEDEMMARRVCVSPTILLSDFKKLVFVFLSSSLFVFFPHYLCKGS